MSSTDNQSQKHHNNFLTTQEAANILDVSVPTIYNYIKENKLKPVYNDKWRIDKTLLFRPEDIERIALENNKPGLSRGDVAERLNVHPSTVTSYFNQGILKYFIQEYKGRELHFVTEEELDSFIRNNEKSRKKKKKKFFNKKLGVYLFQKLYNKNLKEYARIMELHGDQCKVTTEQGRVLTLSEILSEGYELIDTDVIQGKNYITKKGYATFSFKKPHYVNSPILNVIDLFYKNLGLQNMRITTDNDLISIEVKPTIIMVDHISLFESEISLMKQYCKVGEVTIRHNKILIESNLEPLLVHVPKSIKKLIIKSSNEKGITIEDYVTSVLEEKFEVDNLEE
ncbi:hypothetical protein CJ195_15920 [Bacillus sp. UMB0899]|nr:hypothetical protein CJ195_15920 [Bacillus sp. UMB0899]